MSGRVKLPKFKRFVPRLSGPSELEQALRSTLARLPVGVADMMRGQAALAEVERLESGGVLVAAGGGVLELGTGSANDMLSAVALAGGFNRDPSLRS